MKNENVSALKFTGIIMIVFALIYAVVGTLALLGAVNGALPGTRKPRNAGHYFILCSSTVCTYLRDCLCEGDYKLSKGFRCHIRDCRTGSFNLSAGYAG